MKEANTEKLNKSTRVTWDKLQTASTSEPVTNFPERQSLCEEKCENQGAHLCCPVTPHGACPKKLLKYGGIWTCEPK